MKLRLNSPTPDMVRFARESAGLKQQEAAELVHLSAFQRWSEYERGVTPIDPARWALFLLLTGQHPGYFPLRNRP
jgi:transcriptional regulator with XRE-family HTH domain